MKLKCCNNKSMSNSKELSTPEHPVVLKNPPSGTFVDVGNLLSHPSGIVVPCAAVQIWPLLPRTRNFHSPGSSKIHDMLCNIAIVINTCFNQCYISTELYEGNIKLIV